MGRTAPKSLKTALLLVMLMIAWLLWSGMYKPLLLGLGAFSCVLTLWLVHRMGYLDGRISNLSVPRLLALWVWLGKEVVTSSLEVTRIVLSPRLRISPRTFEIRSSATDTMGHAILGNSITTTPGTIALDVHDGVIQVHSLTEAGANALLSGEMDRRVSALFRS